MSDPTSSGHGFEELAAMIRAHAQGILRWEAAAELLIGHQSWLMRADFTTSYITIRRGRRLRVADVDYLSAVNALDRGELPCSGSEANVLRIAASLASGVATINLGQAISGLDADNTVLVLTAIAHANGYCYAELK
jgi:hypothetical protein